MLSADLRERIEELLAAARPDEREAPAAPEVVALSALLLGQVRHATVRRRVADSPSPADLMTWIAVDRLLLLLPPDYHLPSVPRRVGAADVLEAVVDAVANARRR